MNPDLDFLLAHLARSHVTGGTTSSPPTEEFLRRLAEQLGLHSHDLFLVVGRPLPEGALDFDRTAGSWVSVLVQHALPLPAADRERLRARARAMAAAPRPVRSTEPPAALPSCAPGFGPLLVRMLALRNLNRTAAAEVMCLMSDVCKSPSTIAMVRDGVKELDAELLDGFAAVLGVPATVLAALTGVRPSEGSVAPAPGIVDVAGLIWEVRHLTEAQVRGLSDMAEEFGRK
ncbi:hypothetical protein SJX93_04225 [Streptomyces cyaneofuscatus]|uniref:hypothetical protein n=1 Tax=Streptomyces cyaneofuscatus TaxID=66883 RepID=UPI002D76AACC|nr:hypothetical protein [Streptomyces cyaneofuscatus]WRO08863.1 hypothetical protein SJX93_04225 [Streptomyces cyaneofuscatus]